MTTVGGFDMDFVIGSNVSVPFASISMDGDDYVRCVHCGFGGCDLRVAGCGCTLHARCVVLNPHGPLVACPKCAKPTDTLVLFPMNFREIDDARRSKALHVSTKNRSRKRKGGAGADDIEDTFNAYVSERRTGRWSNEEMIYCDRLMEKFAGGELPVADGTKLNEFLGNMLKSKQSRLTKKMKNARLSSKLFKRTTGYLVEEEAREFSSLEESFFSALSESQERAEIKFHMQKEWREQFSHVCAAVGQPLDAEAWLTSVEEMDRRASEAKNAARVARRKHMMGVALRTDSMNPERGVFIEKTNAELRSPDKDDIDMEEEILLILATDKAPTASFEVNGKSSLSHSSPFLAKVTAYMQRTGVPFEHVDLWVPSYVASDSPQDSSGSACRLCNAGCASVDKVVAEDGKTIRNITQDEQFNFFSFGDYSQKFSFDVGCGLPGRVYESGRPSWEQSVQNAPQTHFERCGGALQWGIKTVLGIPIASPNVGRLVVVLYSCFDRPKSEDVVTRLSDEFTRLMPCPKWKLVVDIGEVEDTGPVSASSTFNDCVPSSESKPAYEMGLTASSATASSASMSDQGHRDSRIDDIVGMLGEFMPSDSNSPLAQYISGFMSLRLLLLRPTRSPTDEDLIRTILASYSSYTVGGRNRSEVAIMLARDYMFLLQQQHDANFLGLGPAMMTMSDVMQFQSNNQGLSLFGLPSTNSSLQNSPALLPIPVPGSIDALSIVSN